MNRRKIFTQVHKNKLRKLYRDLLFRAINEQKAEYRQEGREFNTKLDILRVCGKTTPRACKYYLQGLTLNIPFADYDIRQNILNFLRIENERYTDYMYKDTCDIVDQYWDGMAIELSILCNERIMNDKGI